MTLYGPQEQEQEERDEKELEERDDQAWGRGVDTHTALSSPVVSPTSRAKVCMLPYSLSLSLSVYIYIPF